MTPKYKNIAIAIGVIVVIGFIAMSASSNSNKKMANSASEIQNRLQITQIPAALSNAQYMLSAADTPMPTLPSKIKTEITG